MCSENKNHRSGLTNGQQHNNPINIVKYHLDRMIEGLVMERKGKCVKEEGEEEEEIAVDTQKKNISWSLSCPRRNIATTYVVTY